MSRPFDVGDASERLGVGAPLGIPDAPGPDGVRAQDSEDDEDDEDDENEVDQAYSVLEQLDDMLSDARDLVNKTQDILSCRLRAVREEMRKLDSRDKALRANATTPSPETPEKSANE